MPTLKFACAGAAKMAHSRSATRGGIVCAWSSQPTIRRQGCGRRRKESARRAPKLEETWPPRPSGRTSWPSSGARCRTNPACTCSATPAAASSTSARPSRSASAWPRTSARAAASARSSTRSSRWSSTPRRRRCSPSRTSSSSTARASTSGCATTSPIPYIAISLDEDFPRVYFTRERHRRERVYFGPYSSAKRVRGTLDLLGKIFLFRSCEGAEPGRRSGSPCLDYYIKRCGAPCVGYVTQGGVPRGDRRRDRVPLRPLPPDRARPRAADALRGGRAGLRAGGARAQPPARRQGAARAPARRERRLRHVRRGRRRRRRDGGQRAGLPGPRRRARRTASRSTSTTRASRSRRSSRRSSCSSTTRARSRSRR